jgi:hypothetical protein
MMGIPSEKQGVDEEMLAEMRKFSSFQSKLRNSKRKLNRTLVSLILE